MYQKCIKWCSALPHDLSAHYFTHVDKTYTQLIQFTCTTYPRILLTLAPILREASRNAFAEVACIDQTTKILVFAPTSHCSAL